MILTWIKSHLTVVVCGSISLVALAFLVLGILDTSVAEDMKKDLRLYTSLKTPGQPSNEQTINKMKTEQDKRELQIEKILKQFENIGTRKILIDYVLPKIDPKHADAAFQFKTEYKRAQDALIKKLNAQGLPTQADEDEERLKIESEQATTKAPGTDKNKKRPGGYLFNKRQTNKDETKDEITIEDFIAEDATARACLKRAREIYCYATTESLQQFKDITDPKTPKPTSENIWIAQMALWIQQDIIEALANLNNQAAERLPEKDRWVGNLPVKHLVSIAIGGYVPPAQEEGGGGMGGGGYSRSGSGGSPQTGLQLNTGPPPGSPEAVFTKRGHTTTVDVIQFAINLVVEAKMLPAVINAICEAGFYTPLMVEYRSVNQPVIPNDYIYGSAPCIEVRLEFEGCLLRNEYEKWMPETIKAVASGETAGPSFTGGGSPRVSPSGGYPSDRRGGYAEDY